MGASEPYSEPAWAPGRPGEVLAAFARLGLVSFGGPTAHLGYFHKEFVERRRWLGEDTYADLVALCQFLPGPTSSQVGFAIGLRRAGWAGALAAFAAFMAPSAILLVLFATLTAEAGGPLWLGLLHGLKLAAVAVVADAVLSMGRTLAPDRRRAAILLAALAVVTLVSGPFAQVGAILLAMALGVALCAARRGPMSGGAFAAVSRRTALACLAAFTSLLVGLPLLAATGAFPLAVADAFFRAGSLVFGGGHVVLPLLEAETVARGWLPADVFLAGYGAAQAVPGPLFSFAAFLGAALGSGAGGIALAALALLAIFLPGFLLLVAALPFASALAARPRASAALAGANAGVVGLLLAALFDPIFTDAVVRPVDFLVAAVLFLALTLWRAPPIAVVALGALAGALIQAP